MGRAVSLGLGTDALRFDGTLPLRYAAAHLGASRSRPDPRDRQQLREPDHPILRTPALHGAASDLPRGDRPVPAHDRPPPRCRLWIRLPKARSFRRPRSATAPVRHRPRVDGSRSDRYPGCRPRSHPRRVRRGPPRRRAETRCPPCRRSAKRGSDGPRRAGRPDTHRRSGSLASCTPTRSCVSAGLVSALIERTPRGPGAARAGAGGPRDLLRGTLDCGCKRLRRADSHIRDREHPCRYEYLELRRA